MVESNENNKGLYNQDKAHNIILLVWALLCVGCPALILYFAMDFIFPPVPYIIHNCLIGLIIGCAISYGLQKNKYASKKILFILIVLCSISANLRYSFSPFPIPINSLYFCLIVCLGIVGFIFYKKGRPFNVFFIGIILLIHSATCIIYKPQGPRVRLLGIYNQDAGFKLQQLYLLFFFFLSLVIIEAISYEVKKKGYPNKKKVFIWILLCSFITYLSLSVIYYILAPEEFASSYWNFLWIQIKYNIRPQIGYYDNPWGGGMWEGMPIGFKIFGYFINFCKTLTFNKISYDNLVIIVTILICIGEFLITSLCAWKYITYTYFSPSSSKLA
ncbi:MAG: hypothetical protein ABRQ39_25570 [Candidatus Eremiobacterota bacterium]